MEQTFGSGDLWGAKTNLGRRPKSVPRAPQEPLKSAQRRPREPSGHHFEASELEKSGFRRRSVARLGREARSERFSVDFRIVRASADM